MFHSFQVDAALAAEPTNDELLKLKANLEVLVLCEM